MRKVFVSCLALFLLVGCTSASTLPSNSSTLQPTSTPINLVDLTIREVNDDWLTPPSLYNGEFKSGWTLNQGDGSAGVQATHLTQDITINHGGSDINALYLSRQGFNFAKGNEYIITFDVTSSIDRNITCQLLNPSSGEVFANYDIALKAGESQNNRFNFKYSGESFHDGMIRFNLGGIGSYHTIQIANITCVPLDGGNVNVKVNQVGYGTNDQKRALFSYNEGDFFNVIDDATKQVVYQGAIIEKGFDQDSGDTIFYGDFSQLNTPGSYHIETQIGGKSVSFKIEDYPYDLLMQSLLYVLYNQRCGQAVDSDIDGLSHKICHNTPALLNDCSTISVNGGWHDAGDYGRYVNTGAKSVLDLLLAYDVAPFHFLDSVGINESNNGIADILDEARFEIEWILRMQAPNGSFYSKVATQEFADLDVSAQDDKDPLYIKGENRTDIAAWGAAVLMYAYDMYKDIDIEFANKCHEAALRAYQFVSSVSNANIIDNIDEGFVQGIYNDTDDTDQIFLMNSIFYYVLNERAYYDNAVELLMDESITLRGTGWREVGGYGLYFLAKSNLSQSDKSVIDMLYKRLNDNVVLIGNAITGNGYNYSNEGYGWGSNGEVADDALFMALVYDISANDTVQEIAYSAISYLLGRNALNMCFVVGFGTNSPHLIHHRMTISHKTRYIGALVGGPDAYCEDEISKQQCDSIPPAKAYYDNIDSYSTNEMSIYWNASLLSALAILNS